MDKIEEQLFKSHFDTTSFKDRADREAIVGSLCEALKRGDKSLIGNKGYRRFVARVFSACGVALPPLLSQC